MTDFQNFCYYSGPGWYHVELLHWCMYFETVNAKGVKINKEDHIVCVFKASKAWPANTIALMYQKWKRLLRNAAQLHINTKRKKMGERGNSSDARQLA